MRVRDDDEALDGSSIAAAEGLGCRVGWWWCSCTSGVSVVECDEDEVEDKEGNGASMVVVCGVGRPSFGVVVVVVLVSRV